MLSKIMWIAEHNTHRFHIPQKQRIQSQDKLFKKWLSLLHTQSPIQVIDEAVEEPQTTKPETETKSLQSTNDIFWTWFWSLDAAIKIPLLLFVPAFLAVNAIYGAEVTKELSPLWIAGPLIVPLLLQPK